MASLFDTPDLLWRRYSFAFLVTLLAPLALFLFAILALDPFDTGRFVSFGRAGTSDERGHTFGISRGRDPRFDAVIVGNSRSVLLDPSNLSQSTGLSFAQMSTPGAGPKEEMASLAWFASHRRRTKIVVVATDQRWCMSDLTRAGLDGFPFALYGASDWNYLAHTFNTSTLIYLKERVLYDLHLLPQIDPESYYDIQSKLFWNWRPSAADSKAWVDLKEFNRSFPGIALLSSTAGAMEPKPYVILWMPPLYASALPVAGASFAALTECKQALRQWAGAYGNAVFLDGAVVDELTSDAKNFLDATHLNKTGISAIEDLIASAIAEARLTEIRSF